MKICKICSKEITIQKRWIYCSDECALIGKDIANTNKNNKARIEYKKEKESWLPTLVEIGKIKHNKEVPINEIIPSNSIRTHLKLLLREHNLTIKREIKMKRVDFISKNYLVVVVTPAMIKTLFDKRYTIYKKNFKVSCLKTVKTLVDIFETVNNYKV